MILSNPEEGAHYFLSPSAPFRLTQYKLDGTVFSHEGVTEFLLKDESTQDVHGRTLQQIVEGDRPDEWGVPLARVLAILSGQGEGPRFELFRDLLDGPIDADKIDYLQRDARVMLQPEMDIS